MCARDVQGAGDGKQDLAFLKLPGTGDPGSEQAVWTMGSARAEEASERGAYQAVVETSGKGLGKAPEIGSRGSPAKGWEKENFWPG